VCSYHRGVYTPLGGVNKSLPIRHVQLSCDAVSMLHDGALDTASPGNRSRHRH